MSLYFATTNHGKYLTLKDELSPYDLKLKHAELELPEPRSDDLSEIAIAKVVAAYDELQEPCITLDAGFYIYALNGFPGSYVNVALNTIGVDGILTLVEGSGQGN